MFINISSFVKVTVLLIIFLVIISFGYNILSYNRTYSSKSPVVTLTPAVSPTPITSPSVTSYPVPTNWKTITDTKQGISYQYPEKPPTEYIYPVDWPPQAIVYSTPFTCTEAGSETDRAGKTEKVTVNGHTYCVTTVTQGAAGSIYNQYAYATELNSKTIIFTFTLRLVQCGNYNDPQKTACETERQTFQVNSLMDKIIQSVHVIE